MSRSCLSHGIYPVPNCLECSLTEPEILRDQLALTEAAWEVLRDKVAALEERLAESLREHAQQLMAQVDVELERDRYKLAYLEMQRLLKDFTPDPPMTGTRALLLYKEERQTLCCDCFGERDEDDLVEAACYRCRTGV